MNPIELCAADIAVVALLAFGVGVAAATCWMSWCDYCATQEEIRKMRKMLRQADHINAR